MQLTSSISFSKLSTRFLFVTLTLLATACAREGATATAPRRCIEGWPQPRIVEPLEPLDNGAPSLLWRKSVPASGYAPETVLTAERLALVSVNTLWIVDLNGDPVENFVDMNSIGGGFEAGLTADADGNFYFASSSVFSFTKDGALRWKHGFGRNLDRNNETVYASRLLLSPDNVLYVAASDGYLYAIAANSGKQVWKERIGLTAGQARRLRGGAGDTLFVDLDAHSAPNGKSYYWSNVDTSGRHVFRIVFSQIGIADYWGYEADGVAYIRSAMLDECGNQKWSHPADIDGGWNVFLTDGQARTYVGITSLDGRAVYERFDKDGTHIDTLTRADRNAYVRAIGADGTLYGTQWEQDGESPGQVYATAYTPELSELWRIPLGGDYKSLSVNLGPTGIYYLTVDFMDETVIFAIQTNSPGPMNTPGALRYFNNRRTGWLE